MFLRAKVSHCVRLKAAGGMLFQLGWICLFIFSFFCNSPQQIRGKLKGHS